MARPRSDLARHPSPAPGRPRAGEGCPEQMSGDRRLPEPASGDGGSLRHILARPHSAAVAVRFDVRRRSHVAIVRIASAPGDPGLPGGDRSPGLSCPSPGVRGDPAPRHDPVTGATGFPRNSPKSSTGVLRGPKTSFSAESVSPTSIRMDPVPTVSRIMDVDRNGKDPGFRCPNRVSRLAESRFPVADRRPDSGNSPRLGTDERSHVVHGQDVLPLRDQYPPFAKAHSTVSRSDEPG